MRSHKVTSACPAVTLSIHSIAARGAQSALSALRATLRAIIDHPLSATSVVALTHNCRPALLHLSTAFLPTHPNISTEVREDRGNEKVRKIRNAKGRSMG